MDKKRDFKKDVINISDRRKLKKEVKENLSLTRKALLGRKNALSNRDTVIVDSDSIKINTVCKQIEDKKSELLMSVHFSSTHILSHDNKSVFEIASNYNEIQNMCMSNIIELERDQLDDKYRNPSLYVACREIEEKKMCTNGLLKEVKEFVPYNIIRAMDMLDAIRCYEEENGKKSWVSIGDRQVYQKGFDKGTTVRQNSTVLIFKIQRDCCLVSKRAQK